MKKYVLDGIKIGSRIELTNELDGVVFDICEKVTAGDEEDYGKILSIRLFMKHPWGNSYYTFRHDGRCSTDSDYDILSINN